MAKVSPGNDSSGLKRTSRELSLSDSWLTDFSPRLEASCHLFESVLHAPSQRLGLGGESLDGTQTFFERGHAINHTATGEASRLDLGRALVKLLDQSTLGGFKGEREGFEQHQAAVERSHAIRHGQQRLLVTLGFGCGLVGLVTHVLAHCLGVSEQGLHRPQPRLHCQSVQWPQRSWSRGVATRPPTIRARSASP